MPTKFAKGERGQENGRALVSVATKLVEIVLFSTSSASKLKQRQGEKKPKERLTKSAKYLVSRDGRIRVFFNTQHGTRNKIVSTIHIKY